MSKFIEEDGNGKTIISLDDPTRCDWMYNEVCCNDRTHWIADYPSKEDCISCSQFKKESFKGKNPKVTSLFE